MARTRKEPAVDPATGKTLLDGATCRDPKQSRARKLVKGVRITKTFESASLAAKWLAAIETDVARGRYMDQTHAQRCTLACIIERYQDDCLGADSDTFHDMRHIATPRLAKSCRSPLDLKRVTGHKDLKSLDRYYHTTAEELAVRAV